MNKNGTIKEPPVIMELKDKLKECRNELLSIMEDWYHMQYVLQPRLIFQYESLFGDLEVKIKHKNRSASELERRVELLSKKIKMGEQLTEHTLSFVEKVVENEFNMFEKANVNFGNNGTSNRPYFRPAARNRKENLPHVYRSIVKIMHPDAAGSETEIFKKHWDNVQHSYRDKDLEHLMCFYKTLCVNPVENADNIRSEEKALKNEISELEYNIYKEKRKLERIKTEEPFVFEEKLQDKIWIARQKRKLRDQLFKIDLKISHNKRTLRQLTSGIRINGNESKIKSIGGSLFGGKSAIR